MLVAKPVYRLLNLLGFVAFKMGRLPGVRAGLATLPQAARSRVHRRICLEWPAMSKRPRVEWPATKTTIAARIRNYLARPRRRRSGAGRLQRRI
jgi:hypothetical protein